jgi:hypothetical protein
MALNAKINIHARSTGRKRERKGKGEWKRERGWGRAVK